MKDIIVSFLLICICVTIYSCHQIEKEPEDSFVIVIGGGLMGSTVSWHLAQDGMNVLLLEKQDSIYQTGSSYGTARIARSNNRGNDIWSYMHNSSVSETANLIAFLNKKFNAQDFSITDIYTTSPVSYVGRSRIYNQLMSSLERQNVAYKIATDYEEGKNLFDVNLPDSVLLQKEYNKHSGTINPNVLIKYLHKALQASNGVVTYGKEVLSIKNEKGIYYIETIDGQDNIATFQTKNIVVAAGPYTGPLLKEIAPYFEKLIDPQRVFLAFYSINKESYESLSIAEKQKLKDAYPVINSAKGTRDGSFFSMIEYYDKYKIPVIKIGGHFQRTEIENLDDVWKKEISKAEMEWSLISTLNYFEILGLDLDEDDLIYDHGYSCVYSLTETEIPLVTPIIGIDNKPDTSFIVMGGMSGVGAKGAMTYGRIAADYVLGVDKNEEMYQTVKEAFGFQRLLKDVNE